MERTIDIISNPEKLNTWARQSIALFNETTYLDNIQEIYPFEIAPPQRLQADVRRGMLQAHQSREIEKLLGLLTPQTKFPYEDPIWYLLKNVKGCLAHNQSKFGGLQIYYIQ